MGTKGDGYFELMNPEGPSNIDGEKKFHWRHFDQDEGLYDLSVIGFASQIVTGQETRLAVLHPGGLTVREMDQFIPVSINNSPICHLSLFECCIPVPDI